MSVAPRRKSSRVRPMDEVTALLVPRRSGLRVSDRVFERLCRDNRDLRLERTARGELNVRPPAGTESGGQNGKVTQRLGNWTDADGAGVFFDSSAGYKLPNGAIRSPDASWIARERWDALSPGDRKKFAPICPDFVVELMSPSDTREETRDKMREWIDQGARLGWLLDPKAVEVEIYRPGRPPETLVQPHSLQGENVLPGFVMELRGILFT